ncbi:MAG: lipocalin family protein, partial [bacterium]
VAESLGNGTSSIDTIQYDIMKNTETELELKQGDYTDKYTKQ